MPTRLLRKDRNTRLARLYGHVSTFVAHFVRSGRESFLGREAKFGW